MIESDWIDKVIGAGILVAMILVTIALGVGK